MSKISSRGWIGFAMLAGLALARPAAAQGPYEFYPINPCRVYDSRPSNYWLANVNEGGGVSSVTRKLAVRATTACPEVAATAQAIAYNVTVVNPTYLGHLTLYPSHLTSAPLISSLNFTAGSVTANGGIVKLNPSPDAVNLDLGVKLVLAAPLGVAPAPGAHLVLDVTGYFQ